MTGIPKNRLVNELTEITLANVGNVLALIGDMELERLNGVEFSDKAMYAQHLLITMCADAIEWEYQREVEPEKKATESAT